MATKFIEIPMVTIHGDPRLMDERPRQMRDQQIAEREAVLTEYNRLRELGYQVDLHVQLGTYGQAALGLVMYRLDKNSLELSHEFTEASWTPMDIEKTLGLECGDQTLSERIQAVYGHGTKTILEQHQRIQELEAQLAKQHDFLKAAFTRLTGLAKVLFNVLDLGEKFHSSVRMAITRNWLDQTNEFLSRMEDEFGMKKSDTAAERLGTGTEED